MTLNRDELQGDDAPDEKRRGKVARARTSEERAPSRADPPETLASEFGSVGSIADVVSSNPEHEFTRGGPDSALPEGFARYNRHGKLGSGGMGDVVVARDLSVGRDVAMKMVRERLADKADIKSRFLLEARVQGQLEHPSVVPVYDLGVSPDRQLYFTMKRVRGTTLEEVLDRLDRGDEEAAVKFGRRRLLADFSKLCLAVHYVHERGVLHRDLKPANVMLGDYGEVYLLDWGLAKVLAAGDAAPPPVDLEPAHRQEAAPPPAVDPHMAGSAPAHTHFGALVGTPGYMAPEQILKVEPLDRRADVYGLGAILFELLTGERMHRARGTQALVESSLSEGTERRASVRAPELEVPPELEALVLRATASEREERLESAKALHEALERYLDGDRDQVARRAAAADAVNRAQTRVAAAIDGGDDDARVEALRQLGHALALDPENVEALRSLVALLTEPPPTMPEAVADELTELEEHQTRGAGKVGAIAFGSLNLYLPLMLWMGVVRWWPLLLFSALTTLTALISLFVSRLEHPRTPHAMAVLVAGLATASVSSSIFGPFVLAPSIVAVITLLFSLNHPPEWRGRIIGLGIGATMLPAVLEWSGVLPTSMAFSEAGVTLLPRVTHFPRVPALLLLVIGNLAVVVTAGAAMAPIRQELDDAQARVRTTAWQLRQLVPEEVDRQTTAVRAERPLRAPSRRTGGSASSRRGRGTRPGTGANLARTRDSGASSATGRSAAPVEGGAGGSEESEPGAGRRDAGTTLIDSGY